MRRVITVHGMKRSGNHAIINWLRQQEKSCFFNDIIMIKPILLGQKEIPPSQPFTSWLSDNHYKKSPLSNLAKKIKSRNRSLYVSLEDHELSIRPFKDIPIEHINILIIRDATNHLASRLKSSLSNNYPIYPAEAGPQMDRVIATWKSHAREFLGETNQLNNKVCIYYDRWFSSQTYRKRISKQLDLEFSDRGFSRVSNDGGGSSFDGRKYDGNNQMMDVLNRKHHLSPEHQQLLEDIFDDELTALNEKLSATVTRQLND